MGVLFDLIFILYLKCPSSAFVTKLLTPHHSTGAVEFVPLMYCTQARSLFRAFSAASGCCLVAFRLKTTLFFFPRCKMMAYSRASINHRRWSVGNRVTFARERLSRAQENTGRVKPERSGPFFFFYHKSAVVSQHEINSKMTLNGFFKLYQTARISQG